MALHRDIHWVGKQWAVTGYGIQACNQKKNGQFDIAASRLWDEGVQDAIRAENWVNAEDFENAVATARKYYPEPPRNTPSPATPAPPPAKLDPPQSTAGSGPMAKPTPARFDLRTVGHAKLTPVWRIRTPVAVRPDSRPRK